MVQSNIVGISNWNWDGDQIVHDPIIPSSRSVVGYKSGHEYDIDVREFLITERNALIQKTLREDIVEYIKTLPGGDLNTFHSRSSTSFDYRAFVISSYVSEKIAYKAKGGEPWQFPDETLYLKHGDCEDRAFLIASLMIGAGISPYNIRVAMGKIILKQNASRQKFDHMWVMYKNEAGQWTLIEPLKLVQQKKKLPLQKRRTDLKRLITKDSSVITEYHPYFLFNDSHLWAVADPKQKKSFNDIISVRKRWKKFNPKFAGEVHQNIMHAALAGADQRILNAIDQYFSRAIVGLFGPIVDDIDRRKYNPLDHFDNAYIKEGWVLVNERLKSFASHNTRYLDKFALAAHAIADFYAHSSYPHFAKVIKSNSSPDFDYIELYNPDDPQLEDPEYTLEKQFDLSSGQFSVNNYYWDIKKHPRSEITKRWKGKIISGRYAQKADTQGDLINKLFIEGPTNIPDELLNKKDVQGNPDFPNRGSLPHHNEIAVDEEKISNAHKLYFNTYRGRTDRMSYKNQFKWRKNSAIRHVRKIFEENWKLLPLDLTPLPK